MNGQQVEVTDAVNVVWVRVGNCTYLARIEVYRRCFCCPGRVGKGVFEFLGGFVVVLHATALCRPACNSARSGVSSLLLHGTPDQRSPQALVFRQLPLKRLDYPSVFSDAERRVHRQVGVTEQPSVPEIASAPRKPFLCLGHAFQGVEVFLNRLTLFPLLGAFKQCLVPFALSVVSASEFSRFR